MDVCRLCKCERVLCDSHIIPKGFLVRAKRTSPQLIRLSRVSDTRMDNVNWNEKLLCKECETHLNMNYETSQIAFLRNWKISHKHNNKVTFRDFNFDKFYIFWLSILWRASVSDLEEFSNIKLTPEIEEVMRGYILSGNPRNHKYCFSEILQLGIIRVSTERWFGVDLSKDMLSTFAVDIDTSPDRMHIYLMAEGFLVSFYFCTDKKDEMPLQLGRVKRSSFLKVQLQQAGDTIFTAKIFDEFKRLADRQPNF